MDRQDWIEIITGYFIGITLILILIGILFLGGTYT